MEEDDQYGQLQMKDLLLEYLKHIILQTTNFMDNDMKQISLCSIDKNKELNIKLK